MTPAQLLMRIHEMAKAVYDPAAAVRVVTGPDRVVLVIAWRGTEHMFAEPTLGAAAGAAAREMSGLATRQRELAEATLRDCALAEASLAALMTGLGVTELPAPALPRAGGPKKIAGLA